MIRYSSFPATLLFCLTLFPGSHAFSDEKFDALYLSKVEQRTFSLINAYRDQNHLSALRWNEDIAASARTHSGGMASGEVDFGHDGFGDRVRDLKKTIQGVRGGGENVFMTDTSDDLAVAAVQTWLHSPHHLENIRGNYTDTGIGIAVNAQGQFYFTQLFLKVEKEASPAAP